MKTQLDSFLHPYARLKRKGFALPSVVFIISLLLLLSVYSIQQTLRNQLVVQASLDQMKLDQAKEAGEFILLDLFKTAGKDGFKMQLLEQPKVYLKSSPVHPEDIVLVYTFINETSTKMICQMSAFMLKPDQKGIYTHPLLQVPLYVNSYYKCYVLSHQYIYSPSLTMKYTISTEEATSGKILKREIAKVFYSG
ncbi:MAG: hypothetical protein PHX86_03105 [Caldisericia bacterium]|nr:hypothetical protein [Caldisericia bacterium]